MENELNVKVGDRLIYRKHSWGSCLVEKVVTVTKVTPTGRIRISDYPDLQFDKTGRELGKRQNKAFLLQETEENIKRIQEKKMISLAYQIVHNLDKDELTYEQALKIIEMFGSH